ncbi:Calcium-activated chloride channel regulator 1 [Portunus trituberculatus]|uniref:Calcium-activated chloride channel regulator 1 n=1 Tax=Portunus trituberculatus TaxID=210409 RepID=A0A5B7F440_PORTR|nr:Calcium-activated chloride channel regulator 1 [Portunus trituberculatus]
MFVSQVWEFCDTDTHDKDSPTPHNLLCGANSVWDVMRRHPDFTLNHATSTTAPATHSPLPVSLHTAPDPSGASFSPIPAEESTQGGAASEDTSTERQKFPTASSDQLHPSASPLSATQRYMEAASRVISGGALGGSSGAPGDGQVTHSDREGSVRLRRRRSGVSPQPGVIPMRPSLVTAHIAASSSASSPSPSSLPLLSSSLSTRGFSTSTEGLRAADLTFQHDPTTRQRNRSHAESSRRVDVQQQQQQHQELNGDETGKERKEEEGRRANNEDWAYLDLTTTTTMSSVFPPPSSFSSSSLPSSLPPPPEIEFLAPAPSVVVLALDLSDQAIAQMLEDNGVVAGSGVLLLAACNPLVTPSHLSHPSIAIVHTLALCSSTTPFLDQLAHPEGAWVLSGTSPSEENSGDETGEQRVAEVLTAATQAALAFPGDPMLTKVGGVMVAARRSSVESSGPYSTVRGQVTLPQTSDSLLIVITTQHHAKIVEITSPLGKEVDLVRDSSQRFWAVMEQGGGRGNFSYALKFLTSSVAFPVPIAVDVYARRPNSEGVTVTLHTSNSAHHPLEPNSPPLVVWARVTHGGRPVVGARVLLRVSRLSESGAADTTVELLDNGNAEPDVRAQDGVYTRYLTWLPGEGRYALSAHATDHQGAASVLRLRRRDGRMVPISAGQFVKSSGTVTLTVARVTSADLVPPSRITDLAVTPLHGTFVNLTWSAPGGDLDQGSAWQYELKMYTEHDALSEHRFNTSTIAVYCITQDLRTPTPPPAPYGTPQHCLTELPFTNLSDVYGGEPGEPITAPPEAPLVECRPRASVKYASPVRFGVLTNGSIMRDGCQSSSSTSSSKPSEDTSNEDVKYRDLSETTSNSTTDGGASAASTATTDTVPLPLPPPPPLASLGENARAVPVTVQPSETEQPLPPPPPPPSQVMPQPLGIPGPTVISIHSGPSLNSGYSSDEDGGFRPRTVPGPGPRRYLPTHFSSFRYLPPPPEYRSAVSGSIGISGAVDYPTCHTISRAATTLPHGTVRSVKKRRHISFV